jgi:hypothetical protein
MQRARLRAPSRVAEFVSPDGGNSRAATPQLLPFSSPYFN